MAPYRPNRIQLNLWVPSHSGAKNVESSRERNWTYDEVVLALALYRKLNRVSEEYDSEVVDLASVVGRSPDSVVYKIANLRFLDTKGRRGLSHLGRTDRQVWSDFIGKDDDLRLQAESAQRRISASSDAQT